MQNHRTVAFIDGDAYFTAIRDEITTLGPTTTPNRFFYLSAWWLGLSSFNGTLRLGYKFLDRGIDKTWDYPAAYSDFTLPGSKKPLEEQLEDMVNQKVDVRVLPWVSPFATTEWIVKQSPAGSLNLHTLVSVRNLRAKLGPERVVLNLLAHTFGAAHCKLLVCGDDNGMRAYTSGLDPFVNRLNAPLSEADIRKAKIDEYKAKSNNEMDKLCDALGQNILQEPLYEVVRHYMLREYKSNLPDYSNFVADKQKGKYDYTIEVRWRDREWKLTFVAESATAQDEFDVDIFLLKRLGDRLSFLSRPDSRWHDIGVKVEGLAAGEMFAFFRAMWNEQLSREVEKFNVDGKSIVSHDQHWEIIKRRGPTSLPPNKGKQYVQVLRTIPEMNFTLAAKDRGYFLVPDGLKPIKWGIRGGRVKIGGRELKIAAGVYAGMRSAYDRRRLDFASHGCFEFKVALKQAISGAEEYIFIADQSLYALEIMDWINAKLLKSARLKVILFYGADPADPPNSFLSEAMNNHLLKGVGCGKTDGQPRNVVFYEWIGNTVHPKVTIIDDVWCAIGSANCMRRSLYMDIELSVSILEPKTADDKLPTSAAEEADPSKSGKSAPSFVQQFRRDLWAHYCGIPLDPAKRKKGGKENVYTKLLSLKNALPLWNPVRWKAQRGTPLLRADIFRQNLNPFPTTRAFNQREYDQADADSRKAF